MQNIDDLRLRSDRDPTAAVTLADLLSLHPFLGEPAEVVSLYRKGALAGSPEAQAALAELALRDQANPDGPAAALSRWRELANSGYAQAMLQYGYCQRRGIGAKATPEAGLTPYLTAAAQGNTTAFALLGLLYQSRHATPRQLDFANAWLELAALRGFPATPKNLPTSELAQAIKANIQGLGPRIAKLSVAPADAAFPAQFAAAVSEHFSLLNQPEVALDESVRRTAVHLDSQQDAAPLTATSLISWFPRRLVVRGCLALEGCIHILAGWPPDLEASEMALPLSAMTPATHEAMAALSLLVHLPLANFEAPVLLKVNRETGRQAWRLDQAARLAKANQGDHSGRRLVTAWLVLANSSPPIEFELRSDSVQKLEAGDMLCAYEVSPDGQPSGNGILNITCDGEAWLLRLHVCERAVWPNGGGEAR